MLVNKTSIVVAMAVAASLSYAATADEPGRLQPPQRPAPSAPADSKATSDQLQRMDARIKAMAQMHEKMTNAKTADERQALMADHMKAMHEGMEMMKGMGGRMHGMSGMKGDSKDHSSQHRMMEKRMEMMSGMMEMMMDRLPPASPK